jgi:uncharacterized protein (TIGR00251 family)
MNLHINVIPSSSKDSIAGWLDNTLKIKVKAPPEKGKANKAVIKLLEKHLMLPKGSVNIETGQSSQLKVVTISGENSSLLQARLNELCDK